MCCMFGTKHTAVYKRYGTVNYTGECFIMKVWAGKGKGIK